MSENNPPLQEEKEKPKADRKKIAREIKFYSYAFIAFALLLVVLINCFVRVPINGDSMLPSYRGGQTVWANKWKKPIYGSVVILNNPYYKSGSDIPEVVIKRVWGFEGDKFWFDANNDLWRETSVGAITRVQIDVDFEKVQRIFLHSALAQNDTVFQGYGIKYTVPGGCVFVLGDNYNNSEDGRYYGGVPLKEVIGVIYD